jgi:hypothetical protein
MVPDPPSRRPPFRASSKASKTRLFSTVSLAKTVTSLGSGPARAHPPLLTACYLRAISCTILRTQLLAPCLKIPQIVENVEKCRSNAALYTGMYTGREHPKVRPRR